VGAAKTALALVALAATSARAEPNCTGTSSGGDKFAACFDPGNRLSVTAETSGFGGSLELRHIINFDDEPDLIWKLDHTMLDASYAGFEDRFAGRLYRGVFIRHLRDGHIVLPFGTPKKIFLPFDIGGLFEVGNVTWSPDMTATLGVIKTALLFDFARSRDFHTRFAIGPLASWDIALTRDPVAVADHAVAPFTAGLADLRIEGKNGLTFGELRVEAGRSWHTTRGWQTGAVAEATVERVVLAVNDRPIALVAGARYDTVAHEATAGIGVRLVLFQRADPRVSLHPLGAH
jgi:hypothetical protein